MYKHFFSEGLIVPKTEWSLGSSRLRCNIETAARGTDTSCCSLVRVSVSRQLL